MLKFVPLLRFCSFRSGLWPTLGFYLPFSVFLKANGGYVVSRSDAKVRAVLVFGSGL